MNRSLKVLFMSLLLLSSFGLASAQSSTGSISGVVTDERQSVIPGASVTVRNVDTGFSRTATADSDGRYKFVNLPIGSYEVTVEAANFAKYVQTGIQLVVNQDAVIDTTLKAGRVEEVVTVTENASLLNTTTPEVSTRFDQRRLSELPIATNRNVFNVLLSVPGVSQLSAGQTGFANGLSFSANGGRLRSNNFMLDGQDTNDPSVSGGQIPLNNPDAFQEARIITNQFLAEYGRNSGSIVNFIGKSGTNEYHGSLFWFHNNERLNACNNSEKQLGFCNENATDPSRTRAPRRLENQIGFTVGGPLTFPWFGDGDNDPYIWKGKDKTFFFGDYQRWSDRQFQAGTTLRGAPTAEGRAMLSAPDVLTGRPQVAALLQFVPAGTPNGTFARFFINGQERRIPLGNLVGSEPFVFDDHQGSFRIDHRFSDSHLLYGRYRFGYQDSAGSGQVTPQGLTNIVGTDTHAATIVLNSILTTKISNEARIAWTRFDSTTNPSDPSSETIPSLEVTGLGLNGFNAAVSRTAIGLGVNLPQFRINDTYQITDSMSYLTGDHAFKFGVDLRRTDVKSFFFPTVRGRLLYPASATGITGVSDIQSFIDDRAQVATINLPLGGGDIIGFYRWHEFYVFGQDEWKIRPNLTLTFGLRYEYPGDSFSYLKELNQRILAANGNNPAFRFDPEPKTDTNNLMPRIGFNWNPRTSGSGILGFITGGDKLVLRGGYSRTYDANFININLNVFSSFPFVAVVDVPLAPGQNFRPNAFSSLQALAGTVPNVSNPNLITRTVVSEDFRAPATDQFSFEVQRELSSDMVMKVGYVRTRGTGLFQTVDGNPRTICPLAVCPRADPSRGVIRLRTNSAQSTYDALQVSFEKRLSRGFSGGMHYTFSTFIDDASELFNPSNGEVAVAQDSFNRKADKARSTFDRPHRVTGNVVYELPFYREQNGFVGRILGGWQMNSFFTFQSGAPFTVLLGADPRAALDGISALVGNAIRPNINTNLDLSGMSIPEILEAGGVSLFASLRPGQRVGDAGRNILRADSIKLVDFGVIKNTRLTESVRVQFRADMFNVFNYRNFGVPLSSIASPANFLNQWGTNGGNRRIILGARLVF